MNCLNHMQEGLLESGLLRLSISSHSESLHFKAHCRNRITTRTFFKLRLVVCDNYIETQVIYLQKALVSVLFYFVVTNWWLLCVFVIYDMHFVIYY